jgi:hypothetical protein
MIREWTTMERARAEAR